MSLHSQIPVALLIATLLSVAADTLQECRAGSGVCNRTAGSIFLQQQRRARRSDLHGVLASACSSSLEDCRDTGCCEDAGYTCFEKNQYWASCRQSCEPGEINPNDDPDYRTPWTCTVLTGESTTTTSGAVNPAPGRVLVTGYAGSGKARLFEFIAALTDQPVPGSRARAVHSSGGAAGGVVSESQGYGLLLSGALLAASPQNDPDREKLMDYTYEMFLGWRRMCELSKDSGSCQEDEGFQCGGGQFPCLPHWKFDDDLNGIIGRGAAPDGDADALAGMLFAVLSLEKAGATSPWLEEVGEWAYDTCKQFYLSSTVSSSSGAHRIVKLGSCWGGWGSQGQNPSYHAPGVYRMCRDYMKSHCDKYGCEGNALEAEWNRLIATSYKMFDATQCESSGLIPNWAKVYEESRQSLRAETGFSGSGTPGAEYGAEASRAVWRVALDYLLFPGEAGEAVAFLDPVAAHLETRESGGSWVESLRVDGNCLVESIHPGWSSNMFMAGPTFTSLVCPSNSVDSGRQQELIDAAGKRVASKAIDDYYSGSWVAISTITLNGDLARAAQGSGLGSGTGTGTTNTGTTTTAMPTTGPPTTTTTTTDSGSGTCAATGQDCRSSACCEDAGFTCYEKNDYWASCRQSCEPGEVNPNDDPDFQTPWTCAVIGATTTPGTTATTTLGTTSSPGTTGTTSNPVPGTVFVTNSAGSGKARLFEFIAALTDQPVPGSPARAVHSSGGAAGGVVSESQGYGLLLSGALLAAMPEDQDREKLMDYTYEMFLGWRRMCELSKASGSCQEDEGFQCGAGQFPCLPHWKFDDDLTSVIGSGAAPDGDADALAGMLLAVLSLERRAAVPPAWLEEVAQWTYETCKQFYLSSTVSSSSGAHRIVKLGSCWGGWGSQGQNPSYHAPGVYRMCRDYMKSHDAKYGTSESEGDQFASDWERLIATSYKMFDATQCESSGLIPNWAKVYEEGPDALRAETGFSGSGTPGAEYGAEASRGVWRVALDFLLFPGEAASAAGFLDPVAAHLETRLASGGTWAQTLRVDAGCLVESIHPSWSWNMFMAGPTFTSLVCPSNSVDSGRQQELIDAAGAQVASKAIDDYYSGSWVAISTITLNGDLLRAAQNSGLGGATGTTGTTTGTTTASTTTSSSTTTAATTTTSAGLCSRASEDCRSTGCCQDVGYTCYEKDQYWAGCRQSCQPGEVNPTDPIEYRTPWSCALVGGTTATTTATTTTTPMSFQMVFEAVDGGQDRACRGDSSTDNSDTYYTVVSVTSIEECKDRCKATGTNCQGVEFKGSRCELWKRPILASKSLGGYTCLRYVDPKKLRAGKFEMVDGEGHACRGATPVDNSNNYFHVTTGQSLEGCQRLCRAEAKCVGVEHHEGGRCEIWIRPQGIQATQALPGYTCWRFWPDGVTPPKPREGSFEAVDGAVGRVCRGSSPSDNLPSYFNVTSASSLDSCENLCRLASDCTGLEFHRSGRCELWRRSIESFSVSNADYSCWRFVQSLAS